jgi:hypothetical protein
MLSIECPALAAVLCFDTHHHPTCALGFRACSPRSCLAAPWNVLLGKISCLRRARTKDYEEYAVGGFCESWCPDLRYLPPAARLPVLFCSLKRTAEPVHTIPCCPARAWEAGRTTVLRSIPQTVAGMHACEELAGQPQLTGAGGDCTKCNLTQRQHLHHGDVMLTECPSLQAPAPGAAAAVAAGKRHHACRLTHSGATAGPSPHRRRGRAESVHTRAADQRWLCAAGALHLQRAAGRQQRRPARGRVPARAELLLLPRRQVALGAAGAAPQGAGPAAQRAPPLPSLGRCRAARAGAQEDEDQRGVGRGGEQAAAHQRAVQGRAGHHFPGHAGGQGL